MRKINLNPSLSFSLYIYILQKISKFKNMWELKENKSLWKKKKKRKEKPYIRVLGFFSFITVWIELHRFFSETLYTDMSTTKSDSMDPVIASLSASFGQVPLAAIPAMLDCILASTGLSPPSLYASLLDAFPNLIKVSPISSNTQFVKLSSSVFGCWENAITVR